jgi:short-subunit dehydrogenase
MNVNGKNIVVTGGGSGLGRALVLGLIAKRARIIALDKNAAGLAQTVDDAGPNQERLTTYTVDLTDKDQLERVIGSAIAELGGVDGVINNAGIIQPFVKLNDLNYEAIERVFKVNFFGTLYMIKSLLPHLLTRPEAHIVNIASMGGFLPVPGQTVYCASKAAVKLLSEGLEAELRGTGVRVLVCFPGAIKTSIMTNSGLAAAGQGHTDNGGGRILEPKVAAAQIIDAIEANKSRVCIGNDSKVMDALYRLSPKLASNLIYKKMKQRI